MKITNKFGLPGAIVEAVKNDAYNPGEATDISVTALLSPPRQVALMRQFGGSLEEDASSRIWALMGQSIHAILERAEPSAITEKRLYSSYNDWVVSGQFDRLTLREATLQDYKMMSVWEVIYGLKDEKVAQLNMLLQLAVDNNYTNISNLEIIGIFRDWSKSKARFDKNYPQSQVARISVPVWPEEQRIEYITKRVGVHRQAMDELPLPDCTIEERWATPDEYAVMKKGRKSAVRVLATNDEALHYIANKCPEGYIEKRTGESKRCQDYCAVSGKCEQWKSIQEEV